MEVLAIIPARGGSKGIPRKNMREVGGIPLLAHTIRHAAATPAVTRVVVSTDDAEIAEVARRFGADVVERPAALSGDTASSESALSHVLEHLESAEGYRPDLVLFLQATSPLRRPDDIANAIDTLLREGADSLLSVCRVEGFVWRIEGGQLSSYSYDYRRRARRQDAPEDLIENGSIYVFKPWVLRELNNRLGGKIAVYRMAPLDSFQVDELEDLDTVARLLAIEPGHAGQGNGGAPDGSAPVAAAELAAVRLLILDFDGVLTDNRVMVDQNGTESVLCNRSDGWGIARLRESGVEVLVLSTEVNPVVAARCRKLSIGHVQGCEDKLTRMHQLLRERGLTTREAAYVGNDVNDLACMREVGIPIAVADAYPEVRAVARLVTGQPGGHGAVREVCDRLLAARRTTPVLPPFDPSSPTAINRG